MNARAMDEFRKHNMSKEIRTLARMLAGAEILAATKPCMELAVKAQRLREQHREAVRRSLSVVRSEPTDVFSAHQAPATPLPPLGPSGATL